jgi:hypothetical protein
MVFRIMKTTLSVIKTSIIVLIMLSQMFCNDMVTGIYTESHTEGMLTHRPIKQNLNWNPSEIDPNCPVFLLSNTGISGLGNWLGLVLVLGLGLGLETELIIRQS